MRLYTTKKVRDKNTNSYKYEKDKLYREWISGYEYNDKGILKLDDNKNKIKTTKPYFITHIPVGTYIFRRSKSTL